MLTTSGYFSVLLSIASQPLFPRAKFLKILSLCLIASGVSFALCCLAIFCAMKARAHNSIATVQGEHFTYNPDAAAVCGVFLFFMIWWGLPRSPFWLLASEAKLTLVMMQDW